MTPMTLVMVEHQMVRAKKTNVLLLFGVEIDDLNAVVCEVKDVSSKSTLFGAPPGWSPLS